MNKRMVLNVVGKIVLLESALLFLPLIVAFYYKENCFYAIAYTILISLFLGLVMYFVSRPRTKVIYAKEGFLITALAWIVLSLIGALPFFFSGEIPSYIDAFFETVSGFTTTGSSILTNVTVMSKGLLFWRSFTHWIGGMGILVLLMAIFPTDSGRSMHILRAEMPGPIIGKLVPKIKDTAKILYGIYIGLTLLEIAFLLIGGMPFFDSVVHAFGTAGTGGFGIKADSIASYSPYLQGVITVFMVIFGVNFNLYFLLIMRRFKPVLKNLELWVYLGLFVVGAAVITINILPLYNNSIGDSIRLSTFQVASVMSTTGYATADFDMWPSLAKSVLFVLMFIGGSAGSTAGGLKVGRAILLGKTMRNDLRYKLHPRTVRAIRYEDKVVDKSTIMSASTYFILYVLILGAVFLLISFEPFSLDTNLSAAVTCFNNVGPGFSAVGPTCNFAAYSGFSKVVLSFAMLFGRLELYPLLFLLTPSTWKKNS